MLLFVNQYDFNIFPVVAYVTLISSNALDALLYSLMLLTTSTPIAQKSITTSSL